MKLVLLVLFVTLARTVLLDKRFVKYAILVKVVIPIKVHILVLLVKTATLVRTVLVVRQYAKYVIPVRVV